MKLFRIHHALVLGWLFLSGCSTSDNGAVASAHSLATQAGINILKQGGNAFDAAIAVSAMLAVVEPAGSGMGGGGFWLLYDAEKSQSLMVDGREKAPLMASRDMYLDENGEVIANLSVNGPLAAAIPGQPAALVWIAENYASLPLSTTLQPAIDVAENGFAVTEKYQRSVRSRLQALRAYKDSAAIFLKAGAVPNIDELIIQKDLARTLRAITQFGHDGFYAGEIAQKLVDSVRRAGGIWRLEDLAQYQVAIRSPIVIDYHDLKITTAALPSSGGLVIAGALNILENYSLDHMTHAQQIHLVVEAMRRAYRDRAEYMGDPDFVDVPQELLLSKAYAVGNSQSLREDKATLSSNLAPTFVESSAGEDTTHFSIVDGDGNRVSATLSINYTFGSAMVAEGTGILLNDEMDDFSVKPGSPNVYGLVGAMANAIESGKRMLSSMSPSFMENEKRMAVIGTPGGSRIISMVLLGALAFQKNQAAEEIVNAPRYHHQYLPDIIQFEKERFSDDVQEKLESKGHTLKPLNRHWGNMQLVILDKENQTFTAASDNRGEGMAMVIE